MFDFLKRKNSSENKPGSIQAKQPANDGLSDTDRKLRDQFYADPPSSEGLSEIQLMMKPPKDAHQLYKELAAFGHEKGWITDPDKYPLMYALLYNAKDTAQAVYWRMQQRVSGDDSNHTKALQKTLPWCVYIAMADAYYCNKNWDDLRQVGLIYKIENTCGFDEVDSFIAETFHIENVSDFQAHVAEIADKAMAPFTEAESVNKIMQSFESMTATFFYGIELAMQYMNLL